jgi:hypothetical protein
VRKKSSEISGAINNVRKEDNKENAQEVREKKSNKKLFYVRL